jgi:hypothetical protein
MFGAKTRAQFCATAGYGLVRTSDLMLTSLFRELWVCAYLEVAYKGWRRETGLSWPRRKFFRHGRALALAMASEQADGN